jgi:hypothetical protein
MYITDSFFENTLLWVFPDYIPEITTPNWQHRLSYFMESQLPIQISAKPTYASAANLKKLIPQYVSWYNANIYDASSQTKEQQDKRKETLTINAGNLIATLLQISKNTLPTDA